MTKEHQETEKRGIRQAIKDATKESGISLLKILAAASAAVTMALISSRLTSIFNSLVLVAVVSVTSALVGEFYRIFFSVAATGTKRVAQEVIVPIVHADLGPDDEDLTETTVIEPSGVDDTLIVEGADADDAAAVGAAPDDVVAVEDVTDDVADGDSDMPSSPAKRVAARHERRSARRKNALRTNQFVQLSLVFGVVSLITVGVVYAVARSQGKTDITYNYTTVHKNPVEQLTPEQQQALVDMAVAATEAQQEASEQDEGETPTPTPGPVEEQLEILKTEVADLTAQNDTLLTVVDGLTADLASERDKTTALEQRLQELEALVGQLQGGTEVSPSTDADR